jgi:predicted nucleic acid-binding protein
MTAVLIDANVLLDVMTEDALARVIGAHAAVAGYLLMTRDAARYRTYFPKLSLIAPS